MLSRFKGTNKETGAGRLKTIIASVLVSSLVTGSLVFGAISYNIGLQDGLKQAGSSSILSNYDFSNIALPANSPITEVVKRVAPSVVGIRVSFNQTTKRYFYGTANSLSQAEGSGIIIKDNGYIVTNYHVIQYADPRNTQYSNVALEVFLADGRQVKARYIGSDQINDLAVIKIELTKLPEADFGVSSKLLTGETAVAIGNPLGLEFSGSVTAGIISSVNRLMESGNGTTIRLLQTDAAINPGNSGGALANSKGEVIGINSMKISQTGVEGIGFAIPSDIAKPIIDEIILYGYVRNRPFLGLSGIDITAVLSNAYKIPVGVYVTAVAAGSGAYNAGIKNDDIITKLAGKEVKTLKDLKNITDTYKAGNTVDITYYRNGKYYTVKMTYTEDK